MNALGTRLGRAGIDALMAVVVLATLGGAPAMTAEPTAADWATALKKYDARILPAAEQERWRRMLADDVRARLKQRGTQVNEAWAAVHDKDTWQQLSRGYVGSLTQSINRQFVPATPLLRTEVVKKIPGDRFVIENVLYETRPGLWVSANLYRPDKPVGKYPAILISHSHHNPKTQGELQDMGMTWARAGCVVLVPDHLGHGERRQHPFATAADYPKNFALGRQDYYFRYELSLQLSLAGETLMGWLVHDLLGGVSYLCGRPEVDKQKIILLGAVAGGGDPAAVAAALDERIACVAPFNFGGPQPETKYPLPADAEQSFDYTGSGSWESTRNLYESAQYGFLPWVIVSSIAPRKLIYAHEFSWDREHDPVWKRLEHVYEYYGARDNLAFTHGTGTLSGTAPEASHCNNIGAVHRKTIHEALAKWFQIQVQPEDEYSQRLKPEELHCWTADLQRRLGPKYVREILAEKFPIHAPELDGPTNTPREIGHGVAWGPEAAELVHDQLMAVDNSDGKPTIHLDEVDEQAIPGLRIRKLRVETNPGITTVATMLQRTGDKEPPLVVAICYSGKQKFLQERATAIGELLAGGVAVCVVDPGGIGETAPSEASVARTSANTSLSASMLMLGEPLMLQRARDVYGVVAHLRKTNSFHKLAFWGDSLAPVNPPGQPANSPHNIDNRVRIAEPQGCQVAYLAACCFPKELVAMYFHRPLLNPRSIFAEPCVNVAHDAVLPGVADVWAGVPCMAASLLPRSFCIENPVDGQNRPLDLAELEANCVRLKRDYAQRNAKERLKISVTEQPAASVAAWLLEQLKR